LGPPRYVLVQGLDADGGFLAKPDTPDVPLAQIGGLNQQPAEIVDDPEHVA